MFKTLKNILAVLAVVALTVSGFSGTALAAEGDMVQYGTYTGSYTKESAMAGTVEYTYSMTLNEDETYKYEVSFPMGDSTYSNEESGTYVVEGKVITFTPSNDSETYAGTIVDGVLATVTKCVSNFASDSVELTFTLSENVESEDNAEKEEEEIQTPVYADTLESGSYVVDISWFEMMDKSADPILILDAENDTFRVYDAMKESDRGNGTVSFDTETGVYTLTYIDEKNAGNTTTFTYDADKNVVTFTSPLMANGVRYNSGAVAEDGVFFEYTATLAVEDTAADTLESGTYAVDLTWIPFMDNMLDPIVEVSTENNTFKLYNAADPATIKGSGTITFENGVYTMVYDDAADKVTTFTYDAETDTITFTSKLYYGANSFDNTDDAGNFVSYTAVLTDLSATAPDVDDDKTVDNENEANDTVKEDTGIEKVQTGDTANRGFLSVLCLAAMAVIVTVIRKRNLALE